MPYYSFLNLNTNNIEDLFFLMKEVPTIGAIIKNKNGEKIKRLPTKPNASIDTTYDPFSKEDFVKVTNKNKDNLGALWDRSREFSERRKDKDGIDLVKQKYEEKQKKECGIESAEKRKEKSKENLKKLGVSLKEKK